MADPITLDEIRPTFQRCLTGPVLLAVSGGADSMALLHLAADWREADGAAIAPMRVVTVDHGLRTDSKEDAAFVAAVARTRGLDAAVLTWGGVKPGTGIQEAARAARYGLLAEAAVGLGRDCRIATAHHEDDLAETLLLRLARGSGVRGLAAMSDLDPVPLPRPVRADADYDALRVTRPLLAFPKARLVATLAARGLAWREDPSNANAAFERVRWREARGALGVLGLEPTALARSARRLARAEAVIASAAAGLASRIERHPSGAVSRVGLATLLGAPAEVAMRVIEGVLVQHGGQAEAPGLAQIEALHGALEAASRANAPMTTTLGGCLIRADGEGGQVLVMREMRASGLGFTTLAQGGRVIWDLRYRVVAGPGLAAPIDVAALGTAGLGVVAASFDGGRGEAVLAGVPAEAIATLPGLYRDDRLLAVPTLGWRAAGAWDCDVQVEPLTLGR